MWSSALAGGEPRLEIRDALEPALSADGRTLAFLRGNMGAHSLWTAPAAGGVPQRYQREPFPVTFVAGYQPTFLPDGRGLGIVIDRASGGGSGEFWILPLGPGTPRRIPAVLPASAWLRFAWWPDSRSVLMGSSDPTTRHLSMMDLRSGAITPFISGTGLESEPAVSPDGRKIAFTSGRTNLDLVEIPLDGSPLRTLLDTASNEESGAWLPSADQYAYITDVTGSPEIWLRHSAENWARALVPRRVDSIPPWYQLSALRASPDGQRIAFDVLAARHGIWIASLAGGRPVPIDTESTDQHSASWSPDGNRIAYRRLHKDRYELVTVALGGGAPVSLSETSPGGHLRGGVTDWSPTGQWICHVGPRGLELVSPDGRRRRLLSPAHPTAFVFSVDGATLYALRRSQTGGWELAAFSTATGIEQKARELPVAPAAGLFEITRHPGGKRLLATLRNSRADIWLMEGFPSSGPWWSRLLRWLSFPR